MASTLTGRELTLWSLVRGPYGMLLSWLLALNLMAPVLAGTRLSGLAVDLLNCGVMLTGIRAASPVRRSLILGATLVVADLASHWTSILLPDRPSFAVHYGLTLVILAYTTATILSAILRNSQITLETLKAAVCVYLLIGLLWVYLFAIIDLIIPGSFLIRRGLEGNHYGHLMVSEAFPKLLYFSYATLTTLGYGDILPLSGLAQTFSYLEAIVGQLYLTVLIARLVGMHITQSSGDGSQRL
jgi:voltage-gated potassium channel